MDKGTARHGAQEERWREGTGGGQRERISFSVQALSRSGVERSEAATQNMCIAGLCFDVMLCGVTAETSCWRQVPTRGAFGF